MLETLRSEVPFFAKRIIDIIGGIVGLLLFSPFFLIIPILIKLTSPGPVFFRQERLGLYGKKFTFLKFRTMKVNNDPCVHQEYVKKLIAGEAESGGAGKACQKPVYKIMNDTRVTSVGRFLRKTSLDELPQFINVLRGEMSLVGPRPPLSYELAHYKEWHRGRLAVKPGLTGLWQVSGRSTVPFDEMVMLDLYYIENWSLALDLKIILRTVPVMLFGLGGY